MHFFERWSVGAKITSKDKGGVGKTGGFGPIGRRVGRDLEGCKITFSAFKNKAFGFEAVLDHHCSCL